jgi:hypothetical protein
MSSGPGYHNRQPILAANIYNLLSSISPSTYDEIAPKIEYWVDYVITEQFMTTDDLVERVSSVAWENRASHSEILRFLKDFRDTPHRSEGVRSFVTQFCTHVLRWFAIAAAEDFSTHWGTSSVASGGWGRLYASGEVCWVSHRVWLAQPRSRAEAPHQTTDYPPRPRQCQSQGYL